MYFRVLNIRSFSTDPGTITIASSASLTHAPKWSCAPRRVASLQNSWAERAGERSSAGSGSLSDSALLLAAAGFASSAASRLRCLAALSEMSGEAGSGGGGGGRAGCNTPLLS